MNILRLVLYFILFVIVLVFIRKLPGIISRLFNGKKEIPRDEQRKIVDAEYEDIS